MYYNLIFVVSPDGFNSNLNNAFPCSEGTPRNKRILLICAFPVLAMCSVSMGKMNYKSVRIIRSYLNTNKNIPLIEQHHMSLQK